MLRADLQGEVFLLVSGRVRVTTYAANGRQVTFRDSEAGAHFGDIAALDGGPRSADVVTLDRVICCYHDMPRLVKLSAQHARHIFGAVYPSGTIWMRVGIRVINLIMRIKRSPFRTFHHDPVEIDAMLRSTGLRRRQVQRRLGWEVVVYERT